MGQPTRGCRTNVLKVRRAILARMLDHDSITTGVRILVLGHIIHDAVDNKPAVLGRGMLLQLLRSDFSVLVVGHCLGEG